MNKKRDLFAMILFGIFTLGIYNLIITLKLIKSFYNLNGTAELYKKRVGMYCLYYVAMIANLGFYAYCFINQNTFLAFIATAMLLFIYITAIVMVMVEYAIISEVSNQYGIVTSEAYRYIVPCLSGFNTFVLSITMQTKLNKIIDLQNQGVTPVAKTV